MVRESGISATKPLFPLYLLPSLKLPFSRRQSTSSSSSSTGSPVSSADTTPASSPPAKTTLTKAMSDTSHLARAAPDTLRCSTCSADLAFASQVISKGFTGRYGRAFLVSPPAPPAEQSLLNIRVGRNENRQLVTGWHVVADISCSQCGTKLGWKYVDAKEQSQHYKVGKYILETERVTTFRNWEAIHRGEEFEEEEVVERKARSDGIVFDSDDDEECEDIFAGVWDPETVATRRRNMVSRRSHS
ncbi:yippee zinc-binding/DNA-binding /Mis18, centromere assembly-domain-containing protein [Thelonectria olida]|uniref:Yippee zinc-binding/DNA-binding /Mis18, centromere assembly-domain-containing protein n=1 Tax=Thelonectria olida TaxID=1576542 RepID=A0A9P8WFB0_9HYPO|nr:yippee zinc-binding/DNA-binding /Mis18, centromere assembly-domain-containing protein [Thelonectria olida]